MKVKELIEILERRSPSGNMQVQVAMDSYYGDPEPSEIIDVLDMEFDDGNPYNVIVLVGQ